MIKFFIVILTLICSLWGEVEVDLNYSSDLKEIKKILIDDNIIAKLKHNIDNSSEQLRLYQKYQFDQNDNISGGTKQTAMLNFAMLKSLVNYKLSKKFTQKELIRDINIEVLKEFKNFKIGLNFIYEVTLNDENKLNNIVLNRATSYISERFATSYVVSYKIKQNNIFSEYIDQSKYGLIKQIDNKILKREYSDDGKVSIIAICRFYFYPFYKAKNSIFNSKKAKNISTNNIKLYSLDQKEYIDKIELDQQLNKIVEDYYNRYSKSYKKSMQLYQNYKQQILQKQQYYHNIRVKLFELGDNIDSFKTLKDAIDRYYDSKQEKNLGRTNSYLFDLDKDISFDASYVATVYNLIDQIKQTSILSTIDTQQSLGDDQFLQQTNNQNIKPLYKSIEISYFIKDHQPKILFIVKINFEQSNNCKSLVLGKDFDNLLKTNFIHFKYKDKKLAIMEHEVTKKEFDMFIKQLSDDQKDNIFPNNRCKNYYKNLKSDQPASCITSRSVKLYIKWLNKQSDGVRYNLPMCKQWQYIASCNNLNRYCWGNERSRIDINENINRSIGKVCSVKSYKPNGAYLYDMCGNVSEYCLKQITKRKKRVRVVGGNYKLAPQPITKIGKYKKGRAYGFRVIKEI